MPVPKKDTSEASAPEIPDEQMKKAAAGLAGSNLSPVGIIERVGSDVTSQQTVLKSLEKMRGHFENKLKEFDNKPQPLSTKDQQYKSNLETSIKKIETSQIYFGDPKYCNHDGKKEGKKHFDDYKEDQNKNQAARENFTKPKTTTGLLEGNDKLPKWVREFGKLAAAIRDKLGWDKAIKGKLYDGWQGIKNALKTDPSKDFDPEPGRKKPGITIEETGPNAATPTATEANAADAQTPNDPQAAQQPAVPTAAANAADAQAPNDPQAAQQPAEQNPNAQPIAPANLGPAEPSVNTQPPAQALEAAKQLAQEAAANNVQQQEVQAENTEENKKKDTPKL